MINKRGVSPVIGTIILIAITVIVAGTIGYYVTGFGTPEEKPNVTISFGDVREGENEFYVDHMGGDEVEDITVNLDNIEEVGSADVFSAGDRITVGLDTVAGYDNLSAGNRITVVHDATGTLLGAVEL